MKEKIKEEKNNLLKKIEENKKRKFYHLKESFKFTKKKKNSISIYYDIPETQRILPLKNSEKYINYLNKSKITKFKIKKKKNLSLDFNNLKFDTKNKIKNFEENVKMRHEKIKNQKIPNFKEFRKINNLYVDLVSAKLKVLENTELYFN